MASPARVLTLSELQALVSAKFPDATLVPRWQGGEQVVVSGVEALDAILPHGGFPKGRLSVWAPQGGATAVLRATALSVAATGERVIWIDTSHTLAGAWWPQSEGLALVKANGRTEALRAAEHLVRSGGFACVIVMGAAPEGRENVRLSRAANEGGSACIAVSGNAAMAGLKISSSVVPGGYRWLRNRHNEPVHLRHAVIEIRVSALGWNRRARVEMPVLSHAVPSAVAFALPPGLPDRRGVSMVPLENRNVRRGRR